MNCTWSPRGLAAACAACLTILTAVLIGAGSMASPAQAQAPVSRILVVHNADSHDPARAMVDAGILSAARAAGSDAVDFSFEYVDLQRFASEADAGLLARQLAEKYAGVGLRAIVASAVTCCKRARSRSIDHRTITASGQAFTACRQQTKWRTGRGSTPRAPRL